MPKPGKKTHPRKSSDSHFTGPRPAWSGTISFGLVSVPVELYPASRPRRLRARMLDDDGSVLSRRYFCPQDDKDLDDSEIVRGYELPDGKYVTVEDDELEALAPKKSREIDLRLFTDQHSLNPAWFEHAYVLVPTEEGTKAYRLLAEVMHHTQRAGIATFVMREREYIIAIVSDGHCLLGETLRFADELRPVDELAIPPRPDQLPAPLLRKLKQALAAKHHELDRDELIDPAHAKLEKLIETKQKRGEVEAAKDAPAKEAAAVGGADVIDLMQVLKRSLRESAPDKKRKAAHKKSGR
ncbi:MAG TPA: Ku protein [Polyangiales bacterium]